MPLSLEFLKPTTPPVIKPELNFQNPQFSNQDPRHTQFLNLTDITGLTNETIDVENGFTVFIIFIKKNAFYFFLKFVYFLVAKICNLAKPAKLLNKTTFK